MKQCNSTGIQTYLICFIKKTFEGIDDPYSHHNAGLHSLGAIMSQDKGSINGSPIRYEVYRPEHITRCLCC